MNKVFLAMTVIGVFALLGGCSQESKEKVNSAGESVGTDMKDGATKAGGSIVEGSEKLGMNVENGKVKLKISNALLTADIGAKNLDVTVDEKGATLKGTVANAKGKDSATALAKSAAGKPIEIHNELTVRG